MPASESRTNLPRPRAGSVSTMMYGLSCQPMPEVSSEQPVRLGISTSGIGSSLRTRIALAQSQIGVRRVATDDSLVRLNLNKGLQRTLDVRLPADRRDGFIQLVNARKGVKIDPHL